jgi:hypothetical protein
VCVAVALAAVVVSVVSSASVQTLVEGHLVPHAQYRCHCPAALLVAALVSECVVAYHATAQIATARMQLEGGVSEGYLSTM